jgi:hypothetical protein
MPGSKKNQMPGYRQTNPGSKQKFTPMDLNANRRKGFAVAPIRPKKRVTPCFETLRAARVWTAKAK